MVTKKQNGALTWHLIKMPFYQYATFTGRARRAEYWLFVLSMIVIATTVGMFVDLLYYGVDDMHRYHVKGHFYDNGTGRFEAHWDIHPGWGWAGWIKTLVTIGLVIPFIAVTSRRLHDSNKSGWVQLLYLIPILGWLLMILFLITEGNEGRNQYGEDPLKADPMKAEE